MVPGSPCPGECRPSPCMDQTGSTWLTWRIHSEQHPRAQQHTGESCPGWQWFQQRCLLPGSDRRRQSLQKGALKQALHEKRRKPIYVNRLVPHGLSVQNSAIRLLWSDKRAEDRAKSKVECYRPSLSCLGDLRRTPSAKDPKTAFLKQTSAFTLIFEYSSKK